MSIKFYNLKESYGNFNNFAKFPFKFEENTWQTSEHFYQASKFEGTEHFYTIRDAKTPREAFNLGNNKYLSIRKDWELVKNSIMKTALRLKFFSNKELKNLLISTNEQEIIENSPIDSYWGSGPDEKGKNFLGKLLMEVRDELQLKNILYTVGNTILYNQAFEEQGNIQKIGKKENVIIDNKPYTGGWVWKTKEEANQKCIEVPEYSVFGLLANWEKDTYFHNIDNCNYLLNTSIIIKLNE